MRNRSLVAKLLLAAIVATVCVWARPSRAESEDSDRRGDNARREERRDRPERDRQPDRERERQLEQRRVRERELDMRHQEHRRQQEMEEQEQIRQIESLARVMEMHKRLSEIFDGAPIAGLMAINKIKDIAAHTGKLDRGLDALERIADNSPVLGLRQAALMSLHELQLADKDPGAAMNSLVRLCLDFDDDDDGDDEDDEDEEEEEEEEE